MGNKEKIKIALSHNVKKVHWSAPGPGSPIKTNGFVGSIKATNCYQGPLHIKCNQQSGASY